MKNDNPIQEALDKYINKKGLQDNEVAQLAYLAGWLDGDEHRLKAILKPINTDEVINER